MASVQVSLSLKHIKVHICILSQCCHEAPGPVCSTVLPYVWSMGTLTLHEWSLSKCFLSRLLFYYFYSTNLIFSMV